MGASSLTAGVQPPEFPSPMRHADPEVVRPGSFSAWICRARGRAAPPGRWRGPRAGGWPARRKGQRLLAALLVVLALPLAACGRQGGEGASGPAAGQKEPVAVTVAQVTRGRLDETVELVGRVRGHVEVAVRPLVAGVVDEVRVQVGDRVQEGQVLVILDAEQAEAQVEQAQA
ncbi:MAG TPA: biotin/lipoyl-binding protein, partial [Thermaerobacter sp.]